MPHVDTFAANPQEPMSDHEFSSAARKMLGVEDNVKALTEIGALLKDKPPKP